MTEHKSFANMVKYNLSALLLAVESGHGGWEDNVAEFVRQGGLKILKEIIEIHSKKGNVEIMNMATEVLRCCTSHPEERKAYTAKVLAKKGGVKILKAAQTAPELTESVGNIMTVLEHCADANGKLMANEAHLKPLIANMTIFVGNAPTLAATARIMEKIMRTKEAMDAFSRLGGVEAIVESFRTDPNDASIILPNMMILDRLLDDMANIDRYNACDGTFEALLGVIDAQANRPDVLQVAGSVLNKIAGKFLEAYLKALVKGDMEIDERDRILRIVAALALDPRNARIINSFDGALPAILALLAKKAGVVDSVLPCIAQIVERCATTDAASWNLIQLGAVEALVKAMQKNAPNKPFQIAACRALAKLATSGRAVDALSSKGGVAEVVKTLQRDAAHHDVALASIDFINNVGSVPRLGDVELRVGVCVFHRSFRANPAHNLTRSPYHICRRRWSRRSPAQALWMAYSPPSPRRRSRQG